MAMHVKILWVFMMMMMISTLSYSQSENTPPEVTTTKDTASGYFSFGTSAGVNSNDGYFSASISPMLIYNFNATFGAGIGYNYAKGIKPKSFTTTLNGGSVIGIINVLNNLQISGEFERSKIATNYTDIATPNENLWYSALFLGIGVNVRNVIVGARYNILYKDTNNNTYPNKITPFVRVLF